MAVDKIAELVADKVFTDQQKLFDALDKNVIKFKETIEVANQYNNALGKSATPRDFVDNQVKAAKSLGDVAGAADKTRLAEIQLQRAREKNFDDYDKKLAKQQASQEKANQDEIRRAAALEREAERKRKSDAKATADAIKAQNEYTKLSKVLDEQRLAAKNLAVVYGEGSREFIAAAKEVQNLDNRLKTIDKTLGQSQRFVGEYERGNRGLSNSINQLTREFPAFTFSVQTGFLALSNNIPIFFDEIKKTNDEINTLRKQGQPTKSLFSQLATSFFSFGTALSIGVTLLTVYGKEIGEFISSLFKGTDAMDQFKARQLAINEASKEANTEFAKQSSTLNILYTAATDLNNTYADRIAAAKELQQQFPQTFKDYSTEKIITGELKTNYDALNISLRENARARAAASQIAKIETDILEAEFKKQKIVNADAASLERFRENQRQVGIKNLGLSGKALEKYVDDSSKAAKEQISLNTRTQLRQIDANIAIANKNIDFFVRSSGGNNKIAKAIAGDGAAEQAKENSKQTFEQQKQVLERSIKTNQDIAEDTKRSYAARIVALKAYTEDQKRVISLNEQQQGITGGARNANQILTDAGETTSKLLDIQTDYEKKLKELQSDASKDRSERIDSEIKKRQSAAKKIAEDENQNFDVRVAAVEKYANASSLLINRSYNEQVKDAGANSDKVKTINNERATAQTELTRETEAQKNKIQADSNSKYEKLQAELYKSLTAREKAQLAVYEAASTERLAIIEQERQQAISELAKQYAAGEIKTSQYNQRLFDIEQASVDKRLEVQIEAAKKAIETQAAALAFGIGSAEDLQKSTDTLNKLIIDKDNAKTKKIIDNAKLREEATKKLYDKEIELAFAAADLVQGVLNGGFQSQQDKIKEESKSVDERAEKEKAAVDRSLLSSQQKADKLALIDAQTASRKEALDARSREVARKQAIADRAFTVARIIGQTAIAVTAALAPPPVGLGPVFGIPLAIATGALGAIQLGTVLSQPLPAFRTGVENFRGGRAIVGDGGSEIVKTGDKMWLTPNTDTLVDLPAGSRVFTHAETMRMLAKPEMSVMPGKSGDGGMREVVAAVERTGSKTIAAMSRNQKTTVNGWLNENKNADKWGRIEKNYFK